MTRSRLPPHHAGGLGAQRHGDERRQGARQLGIANVRDFIRFARASGGLNMASSGNCTSIHLAGELFKEHDRHPCCTYPTAARPRRCWTLGGNMDA